MTAPRIVMHGQLAAPPLDQPLRPPEAGVEICWLRCYDCQLGECTDAVHSWMDPDDIAHEVAGGRMQWPTVSADWSEIGHRRPCGCTCMEQFRAT